MTNHLSRFAGTDNKCRRNYANFSRLVDFSLVMPLIAGAGDIFTAAITIIDVSVQFSSVTHFRDSISQAGIVTVVLVLCVCAVCTLFVCA